VPDYSHHVPLTTVVVFLSGVASTVLMKPLRVLSDVDISLVISGTKIKMNQPRLAGVTRDNRRYDMIARAAAQDFTKAHMLKLNGIRATMEMRDNVIFETTAQGGLYNIKTKQLTLTQKPPRLPASPFGLFGLRSHASGPRFSHLFGCKTTLVT
jgi:hypothetical protein